MILADDLGCYGHPKFKTPHLDRLAASGARLTQFNAPAPFCAPTRASLLTGRYPFRCGMTGNPAPDASPTEDALHLPETEITLAQLLQRGGYATGMIGKWHLGHAKPEWTPTHRGFREYFGILYSNDMRPVQLVEGDRRIEYPVVQANLTKRYTERAVDFLRRHRTKPFFLYLAHAMPHKPLAASEAFYKKSGAGLYGDAMAELDWGVGQVLAELDKLGLAENTFVVFTSDNGPSSGGSTGGLRGAKASSYEGGYRVPCIALMMDLFSTTLKIADVLPPADRIIDGRDIMPLFTSDAASPHEVILGHLGPQVATVRDARWKLHVVPPRDARARQRAEAATWVDPRGPDGVTIIAPYRRGRCPAAAGSHRARGISSLTAVLARPLAENRNFSTLPPMNRGRLLFQGDRASAVYFWHACFMSALAALNRAGPRWTKPPIDDVPAAFAQIDAGGSTLGAWAGVTLPFPSYSLNPSHNFGDNHFQGIQRRAHKQSPGSGHIPLIGDIVNAVVLTPCQLPAPCSCAPS